MIKVNALLNKCVNYNDVVTQNDVRKTFPYDRIRTVTGLRLRLRLILVRDENEKCSFIRHVKYAHVKFNVICC